MKNFKLLFLLVISILLIPFGVFAEENSNDNTSDDNKKVNIYFFRGEGCSHCAEAEEFFNSIEEEYGQYYTIVDYETWYNEDNADLMEKVAEARGEEAQGVPYIIIGDQSWNGYSTDYDDDIKSKIKEVYEQDPSERYDIMKYLDTNDSKKDKDYSSDIAVLILIILISGGVIGGIWFARKKTA